MSGANRCADICDTEIGERSCHEPFGRIHGGRIGIRHAAGCAPHTQSRGSTVEGRNLVFRRVGLANSYPEQSKFNASQKA